ncbi:Sensor histidine kinase YehU [compost metagenome]
MAKSKRDENKTSSLFRYSCIVKIIGFILFVFCFCQPVVGQELYGKFLNHEQGLLSKECYDINIDETGYLIVGTQYGPMKYDGEKFVPICLNLPIERRVIYDFEKDPKGVVYLLNSKNEIFRLKGDKAIPIGQKHSPALSDSHFKKLHWHSKGFAIFSSNLYYNYSFQSHEISTDSSYLTDSLHHFVFDSKKEFPFARYKPSVKKITNYSLEFKSQNKTLFLNEISSSDSREDILRHKNLTFALINHTLYEVGSKKIKVFPYKHIFFAEIFHNRIWLATAKGLIELDTQGNHIQTHFPGLLIGGTAPLPNGGIAVSLNQKGVFISSNINERKYKISPTEIAGNRQHIIIGSLSGQLFELKNDQLIKLHDPIKMQTNTQNFTSDFIRSIEFIDGKWHVCSMKSIYTLSPDLKKKEIIYANAHNSFNNFFYLKKILYGISWSNIFLFYPKANVSLANIPFIRCKHLVNDSVILLGSEDGLFEYHGNSNKLTKSKLIPENYYISHIQALSPNELLISTRYKGIFHFRNGRLIKKIPSPCISLKKAILSDGQLIAAGNEGIFVKMWNGKGKVPWTKVFDGEIQNLFLVNKKLLICIDNDLITKKINDDLSEEKAQIILNKILLGNQKRSKLPSKIGYNIPISFDFDILRFDANKLGLYYRLSGESKFIQYTEGTKVNFEALKSGNYQLELFPVIDGKIQFSNSRKYHFTIEEPFWQSTLFYLLITIVVLLILFSIRLIVHLQRKKRSAERAKLESKLNEYKLLAVKAQVNPHFLSNGLAAIQALILREDNDLAAQYLAKFSYLMRKILYYSEEQFISIREELQLVDAYLELELLRFRNKFDIQKSINLDENQLTTYIIPSLLLQPILENAIWHGLKFQEHNPVLKLTFELNEREELVIRIQDNGPGFQKHNTSEKHLSKGNQLISERIDTLNKQFEIPVASLEIQSSEKGTSVQFTFNQKLYRNQL